MGEMPPQNRDKFLAGEIEEDWVQRRILEVVLAYSLVSLLQVGGSWAVIAILEQSTKEIGRLQNAVVHSAFDIEWNAAILNPTNMSKVLEGWDVLGKVLTARLYTDPPAGNAGEGPFEFFAMSARTWSRTMKSPEFFPLRKDP